MNDQMQTVFNQLWNDYITIAPSAKAIRGLFESAGEEVRDDHIAFRTYNDSNIGLDILAQPFREMGYEQKGKYNFEEKKLFAKHFEHPEYPDAPKIFISELLLEEFSPELQRKIRQVVNNTPDENINDGDLIFAGRIWGKVRYETYQRLRQESEYAAWVYAFGYVPNHFAVFVNDLKKYDSIEKVNTFIEQNGYELNTSGGKIKGTPQQLLQQSSTLAEKVKIKFREGVYEIPSCYYEFTRRYPDAQGNLYQGFIAGSADKIFESTDYR